MRYMTRTIALVATVALSAGALALAANSQHHAAGGGTHKWTPGQGWDHFAATFDANQDGKVTKEEWDAKRAAGFDAADKNHDGSIDKDEYTSGAQELAGSM